MAAINSLGRMFSCIASLLVMHCLVAPALRGEDFQAKFKGLTKSAAQSRKAGDLPQVEQHRWERWKLVREAAADTANASPIVAAYRAIEEADGDNDDNPGLVNSLKYDEAIQSLLAAWKNMVAAHPQGPVLGEVATRIFEVLHQRDAFWTGTTADRAAKMGRLISDEEMMQMLELAEQLDPCCVAAIPMTEWLRPLDPKEAFLRAEVRPSFQKRQERLLAISHPLRQARKSKVEGQTPEAAEAGAAGDENVTAPESQVILPWHAPTEYLKAQGLERILDEMDILEDVLQDWVAIGITPKTDALSEEVPFVKYFLPRRPIQGTTADGSRFELLYGRLLITTVKDKEGRRRTAALIRDQKGRWEQRFLDVLWRKPSEKELRENDNLQAVNSVLERLEVLEEWDAGGSTLRLCAYPSHGTESLLVMSPKLLCVNDAMRLKKLKFSKSWRILKEVHDSQEYFFSDARLIEHLGSLERGPDNPLAQVVGPRVMPQNDGKKTPNKPQDDGQSPPNQPQKDPRVNLSPVVLVSKPTYPDEDPPFFFDDGKPCLKLQNGSFLYFRLDGEGAPICYKKSDVGTLVCPLNEKGVPPTVVLSSGPGQCMAHLLQQAGFKEKESKAAVVAFLESGDVPAKFKSFIDAVRNADPKRPSFEETLHSMIAKARSELFATADNSSQKPETTLSLNDELMLNYQQFGYRHFKDGRGNVHFSSLLADSMSVKDRNKKDSGKEYLFTATQPDGRVINLQQLYSWSDFKSLKANIGNEYLTKSLLFEPSFGTYSALVRDELSPLVHPEDQRPPYLEKDDDTKDKATAAPAAVQPNGTTTFVELADPIQKWVLSEDPDQLVTLTNLHNSYVNLLCEAANNMQQAMPSPSDRWSRTQTGWAQSWDSDFYVDRNKELGGSLLAIQLASARRFAIQRFYHRSIVYYNDLLRRLRPASLVKPYENLLVGIPDTAKGEAFVSKLDVQVSNLNLVLTLQTELAGVLRNAGLSGSAHAVFSRTIDDYENFVKPAIDQVKELLMSYGIQTPPDSTKAIAKLEKVVDLSRRAIDKFGLSLEWRKPEFAKPAEIAADLARTERYAELLAKMRTRAEGKKLSADESREFEELGRKDEQQVVTEFRFWLERKKLLASFPAIGNRIDIKADYDVRLAAPRPYVEDKGFIGPLDAVKQYIAEAQADEVAAWCELPLEQANKAPHAAVHSFLVAWYWLDRGDNSKVRAALLNVAKVCGEQAKAKGRNTLDGYVARLNGFAALAGANCYSQALPGIQGSRVDFTDGLSIQVLFWERQWLASGLIPTEAAEQAEEIRELIEDAHAAMSRASAEDAGGKRYFFPDYRCRYGGVPDSVAKDALERPDLFKKVEATEVGGDGNPKAIKENREWIKLTKEEADGYYRKLRVDDAINEQVLGLD
jgi:hypothetical protein